MGSFDQVSPEEFSKAIDGVVSDLQGLFHTKNDTYKSNSDPLANFTNGGLLLYNDGSMKGRYEALKGYVTKHIVTAMHNDINFGKLEESTLDIAVYFVIATAMSRIHKQNVSRKLAEEQTKYDSPA